MRLRRIRKPRHPSKDSHLLRCGVWERLSERCAERVGFLLFHNADGDNDLDFINAFPFCPRVTEAVMRHFKKRIKEGTVIYLR